MILESQTHTRKLWLHTALKLADTTAIQISCEHQKHMLSEMYQQWKLQSLYGNVYFTSLNHE